MATKKPKKTQTSIFCETSDVNVFNIKDYKNKLLTIKHNSNILIDFDNEKNPKTPIWFCCETCDFTSNNKKDYNRHLLTIKHKNNTSIKNNTEKPYACDKCKKEYNDRTGLWRHNKKCVETIINEYGNNDTQKVDKLVNYLMKENAEFKQLLIDQNKHMVELAKNAGHNITNNTTNNNSFNLSVYLNETCKDALNIMDFVNQLQVGIKDLEETGRLGFANGISQIFINGLKQIDINNRPVHCSDLKREILYIKNNNEWNKEDGERKVLTSAIKHVVNKNIKQIPEWTKVHPDFNDSDSKENDRYLQIVMESMSGSSKEEANKNYNKIIKNIAKETVIEKEKCIVSLSS